MQATQAQADFIGETINAYLASMMQAACVNDNFLEEQAQCEHIEYNLRALNEFLIDRDIGKLVRALNSQSNKQGILRSIVQAEVGLTPVVLGKALVTR
ncbi:hypothetical protein UFOVP116_261 [uncultured Caudovirales phage]|uniref:Uncharacterized protein n=1 Tax=uncultured Caudovirales phage TaxID=2100421 RepID=A0A6J5L9W3_9CAUD|nr:hypothetical protein UFOVP116_261 [uncultured Caudovirales phage]